MQQKVQCLASTGAPVHGQDLKLRQTVTHPHTTALMLSWGRGCGYEFEKRLWIEEAQCTNEEQAISVSGLVTPSGC